MQEMGAGVIAPYGITAGGVDGGQRILAGDDVAGDADPMSGESGQRGDGVVHEGGSGRGHDGARVTDLTPALGVEGCPIEEDLRLPGMGGVGIGENGNNSGRSRVAVGSLPDEEGLTIRIQDRPVGILAGRRLATSGRGPGLTALFVHGGLEPDEVDRYAGFLGDLDGELHRKAIGVMEPEGNVPWKRHRTGRQLVLEDRRSCGQGTQKACLLYTSDAADDLT